MKFLLELDGRLKYTKSTEHDAEQFLIDENVLLYDHTVDKIGLYHLIYLQRNGNLNYVLFIDGRMKESKLSKFDTRSNSYNQVAILIIKERINIFYSYTNVINANINTLHHIVMNANGQEKYNIIKFVSRKKGNSFAVGSDMSGNIHLYYNTVSDSFSYIFYTYFNPFKNQWLTSPIKLSTSEKHCEFPLIFVDSNDNIHGAWWEKVSNGYTLKVRKMSSQGKEMFKWNEVIIPPVIQDFPDGKIYENNNMIIIECKTITLVSKDNGITYINEEIVQNECVEDLSDDTIDDFNTPLAIEGPNFLDILDKIDDNRVIIEQILLDQSETKISLNNLIEQYQKINQKISDLEEALKSSKSGLKKFFS